MITVQILFWLALFLVFYTHLGYGILLYTGQAQRTHCETRQAATPARQAAAGRDTFYHSL